MDQTKLQETIAEFYAKLPPDAQAFFGGMTWMETLKDISVMHNLNPQQIETLGTETTLVLLGIIHLDEYEALIAKELALPKELTEKIISEINDKILARMRASLEEAYAKNVDDINSMGQDEDEDLDPRLALLPKNVQEAITRSGYQKKLYAIGTKHNLQVNQMASLEEVTMKFITGAISPTKYENDVGLATELSATAVSDIAKEVNEIILVPIREYMQEQERKQISASSSQTTEDDEVPIPPYAQAPIKQEVVPATAHETTPATIEVKPAVSEPRTITESILSDAKEPQPTAGPMSGNDQGILADAGIEIVDNVAPSTPTPANFIADKLFGQTKTQAVTSDHSLPKISPAATQTPETNAKPPISAVLPKANDPYHEAI